jgi:RimJ/RimL family protein N-acetyltransferase
VSSPLTCERTCTSHRRTPAPTPDPGPYHRQVPRPDYPIRTPRLLLRPFAAGDLDDLHAYMRDPDVVRYVYAEPGDLDATRIALARRLKLTWFDNASERVILAVEWPEAGRVVGEMSLRILSREHQQGEIGFVLAREFHGKGLAAEGAEATLTLGFDTVGLHRIIGRCDVRNHASAGLMARLGMRREAHFVENEFFKGEWSDEYVYAIRASEWNRQHSR